MFMQKCSINQPLTQRKKRQATFVILFCTKRIALQNGTGHGEKCGMFWKRWVIEKYRKQCTNWEMKTNFTKKPIESLIISPALRIEQPWKAKWLLILMMIHIVDEQSLGIKFEKAPFFLLVYWTADIPCFDGIFTVDFFRFLSVFFIFSSKI